MFRYRERLRAGEDPKEAMVNAVTRVGEAIASAAGVVIIAFMAMALSTLGIFRAMGPSLAIAVAVTLIAGLTLVPAVVSLLGTKVFWPSKAWQREPTGRAVRRDRTGGGQPPGDVRRHRRRRHDRPRRWSRSASTRPSTCPRAPSPRRPSPRSRSRTCRRVCRPAPPSRPTSTSRSRTPAPLDKAQLTAYARQAAGGDGCRPGRRPDATARTARRPTSASRCRTTPESDAGAGSRSSGPLRDVAHAAAPAGATAVVGGITSVYVDIQAAMNHDYSVVFPVAAVLIMIVLGLLLRSVVAPWYLMVSVGLGFASTLGATTLLFQNIQRRIRPDLHAAADHVHVRRRPRHRLQHPDGRPAAGGGARRASRRARPPRWRSGMPDRPSARPV